MLFFHKPIPWTFSFHFTFIPLFTQITTINFSYLPLHYSITIYQHMHPSYSTSSYWSIYVFIFPPSFLVTLTHPISLSLSFSLLPSPQGIGRMILKEEMKARSGHHVSDQWGSRRSSRCSSKETLNNLGYGSLNGCKSACAFLC